MRHCFHQFVKGTEAVAIGMGVQSVAVDQHRRQTGRTRAQHIGAVFASPFFTVAPRQILFLMGTFIYGVHGLEVQIDDRTLAHLRAVVCAKLRKREPFCFTAPDQSQGQVSFWIDSSIPVAFRFESEPESQLNQAWLVRLTASAKHSTKRDIIWAND